MTEPAQPRQGTAEFVATNLALAAIYVVTAKLGFLLAFTHPSATAVWAPTGIALAALLSFGRRLWPGVFIGAVTANLLNAGALGTALAIGAGNTLEAVLGCYLVQRFARGRHAFDRPRDVLRYSILAGVLCPMLSASIGVTALAATGSAAWADVSGIWVTWWLGDAGGALVVAPLLILWTPEFQTPWRRRRFAEFMLLGLILLGVSELVFGVPFGQGGEQLPLSFVFFPITAWAAFRLDARATITVVFVVAALALWGTLRGEGPFSVLPREQSLLFIQVFTTITGGTALAVSAGVTERRRAQLEIAVLNAELERRVAERTSQLARSEALRGQAEEAVQTREEFLAIASHELRTPITSLRLQVQIVERALAEEMARARIDPDPRESAAGLERVLKLTSVLGEDSRRLVRLVNGLLDVARIASGRLELQAEELDFRDVVRGGIDALRPELAQRQGRLTFRAPETLPGRWDRLRLEQVVANLLSNAIRYGEGRPIQVQAEAAADDVVLTVQDQGRGIAPEFMASIFDRFQRGAAARHSDGLGLGLYITREIVESHGGTISVQSELNRGSTFMVRLPRRAAPAGRHPAA